MEKLISKLRKYKRKLWKYNLDATERNLLEKEYNKLCYELYEKIEGNEKKLKEICSKGEYLSADDVKKHANKYFRIDLGKSEFAWHYYTYLFPQINKIKKNTINLLYIDLLLKDYDSKKMEIFQMIEKTENMGFSIVSLRNGANRFAHEYFSYMSNYLMKDFKQIFDDYIREYKKPKNKNIELEKSVIQEEKTEIEDEELSLESKLFLLNNFINGNYISKQQYCDINKIDIKTFDKLVELANKTNIELYNQYKETINNTQNTRYKMIIETIKKLIYYIQNGIIEDNNVTRQFDIIDYYLLIKLDFETILNISKNIELTVNELKLLKTFIAKNKNNIKDKSNDIHQILNPNNKQIIGGRVIELEEKELILNFLKKNKIPKNINTYNIAMRRYLNNTLSKEKTSKKL